MAAEPARQPLRPPPLPPPTLPPPTPLPSLVPPAIAKALTRARVRAAVGKAAVLFVLPLPLVSATVGAMVADDTARLALSAGALGSVWAAGVFAWRALAAEARYILGDELELPPVPGKLLSAVLTVGGAGLSAAAGGHSLVGSSIFAAVGGIGHLCFYGRDMKQPRVMVTSVEGIDVPGVTEQLEQAHRRLRRIDAAARAIAVPEFAERLCRITAIGRDILAKIARDPRDASRARRFLHVYLDSTERVTQEYARTPTPPAARSRTTSASC